MPPTEHPPPNGDYLWAWQSQQPDGTWSVISMGFMTAPEDIPLAQGPRYTDSQMALVLVHRDRNVALNDPVFRTAVASHRATYGQPVRLARFGLDEVEEIG